MPTKSPTRSASEVGHVKRMLIDVRPGSTPNPQSIAATARALTERIQRDAHTGQFQVIKK
jgi:hypothetical protein